MCLSVFVSSWRNCARSASSRASLDEAIEDSDLCQPHHSMGLIFLLTYLINYGTMCVGKWTMRAIHDAVSKKGSSNVQPLTSNLRFRLSPLTSTLTKSASVSALTSTLTKTKDLKSFNINTYKKAVGGPLFGRLSSRPGICPDQARGERRDPSVMLTVRTRLKITEHWSRAPFASPGLSGPAILSTFDCQLWTANFRSQVTNHWSPVTNHRPLFLIEFAGTREEIR
jgi:hypothetical protein